MTTKDTANLLMCCGALQDIAENVYGYNTRKHIRDVQKILEKIAVKYLEPQPEPKQEEVVYEY